MERFGWNLSLHTHTSFSLSLSFGAALAYFVLSISAKWSPAVVPLQPAVVPLDSGSEWENGWIPPHYIKGSSSRGTLSLTSLSSIVAPSSIFA